MAGRAERRSERFSSPDELLIDRREATGVGTASLSSTAPGGALALAVWCAIVTRAPGDGRKLQT
jgi:hypothetical protein